MQYTIYMIVGNKSQVILRLTHNMISFNWDLKKSQLECRDQMIQYGLYKKVSQIEDSKKYFEQISEKYLFNPIILTWYDVRHILNQSPLKFKIWDTLTYMVW